MQIGYAYLSQSLATQAFDLPVVAQVAPVTRIVRPALRSVGARLLVPAQAAPARGASAIEHLLFALKHEGLEMQQALLALRKIDAQQLLRCIEQTPNSEFVRRAAYLWELANPTAAGLTPMHSATVPYRPLFDPSEHHTRNSVRASAEKKWRIDFNGLGSRHYCPSVRRSPTLDALVGSNILAQAQRFASAMTPADLQRVLGWAYLSETQGSDQIERQATPHSKAQRFATMLARAHRPTQHTEDWLCELQRAALSNPALHEDQFRTQQNWLANGAQGAAGVRYVPPAPGLCVQLMGEIMAMANRADDGADALVMAALVSFAFGLAHPFMDGNGRVHRFLFHSQACARGGLTSGMIVPISPAIHANESVYLQALESFSAPARALWDVEFAGPSELGFHFNGSDLHYRYWDATACVSFGVQMAHIAFTDHVVSEANFLKRHDAAVAAIGAELDFRSADLHHIARELVKHGHLSNNWRKKLSALGYDAATLAQAEQLAATALGVGVA